MNDESEKTAVTLSELVVKEFSTRGFAAVSAHELQIKDLKQTTTTRDRFQELSNAMWDRLPEPEGEAKSFQYTLSNFKSLATDTPIDAVIYVRFSGFTRSGGDIAGEVASKTLVAVLTAGFFVQPKDLSGAAVVDIAVVDGRSGDILWGNKVGDSYWGLTGPDFKTDDLTELVSKLLAEFPRRGGDNPSSDIPVEKHNN